MANNAEADEMGDKMVTALDNLANAAVQKNDTFESLVLSNKTLTDTNRKLNEDNRKLLAVITALSVKGGPKNGAGRDRGGDRGGGGSEHQWDPTGYCWSHGYKVKMGHSSGTCERRKSGHDDHLDAKRGDTQGGCEWNKNWKG